MTEKSMLEKLARVMWNDHVHQVDGGWLGLEAWEQMSEDHRRHWMSLVRAVLQALREPSEGMLATVGLFNSQRARKDWQAMIDSILSEPNPST